MTHRNLQVAPTPEVEPKLREGEPESAPERQDDGVLDELLVEEVSIDGMCGVY